MFYRTLSPSGPLPKKKIKMKKMEAMVLETIVMIISIDRLFLFFDVDVDDPKCRSEGGDDKDGDEDTEIIDF